MNKFKKIMAASHTQKKNCLHKIYTDKQVHISSVSSSEQPIEDEKIFYYREISFSFMGTGFRTPERVLLFVWIPDELLDCGKELTKDTTIPCEDWLLRILSEPVNALGEALQNDHKDSREKAKFYMQSISPVVQRRNGCIYVVEKKAFRLRIEFEFALINGHSVNGKSSYKNIKQLLDLICDRLANAGRNSLSEHIQLYKRQKEIEQFLAKNELLAFVADGSILPRKGDTQAPMEGAVPFQSPPELRTVICFHDGTSLSGMGIKKGITVITGGGYSGKSTLLDALEQGIYFHVKGDGREYVIVEKTACKIYAEDGRCVDSTDITPFFSWMPEGSDVSDFSTSHASGSVSQAVNIIEAVYAGSRCLLIDEDTSATNFMIQDPVMRQLVPKESIIPYTDRILELKRRGISTILVIGGSSEYIKYGDCILMMEDYCVSDQTEQAKKILLANEKGSISSIGNAGKLVGRCQWMDQKELSEKFFCDGFFYRSCVRIDRARYIKIDDIMVDITRMTSLVDEAQMNSLAWLLEKLLQESGENREDLSVSCDRLIDRLFGNTMNTVGASYSHQYEFWLEQVRSIDLVMAAVRMRKG
ncbi:MAG: ABC-ATPase domain-containing protein [Roseburia sp.]|nr:ABC-ATPase domain-containing protein [Roseburia sp.]